MRARSVPVTAIAISVPLALAGCSGAQVSSGSPPIKVCGEVISDEAEGAIVQDVSTGKSVTRTSIRGNLYLKVTDDCAHGVKVAVNPSEAGTILRTAKAEDGRAAGVVIQPVEREFDVDLTKSDGTVTAVRVSLTSVLSSSPPATS